jgi:hypothetical protein
MLEFFGNTKTICHLYTSATAIQSAHHRGPGPERMAGCCRLYKAFALILLFAAAGVLNAQEGLSDAFARLNICSIPANIFLGPSVAAADFNHDKHADGALLIRERERFRIEVHLRSHRVSAISFASNLPALSILAFDVNGDGSPDLVVQDPFSRKRLFVWINDGHGAFHSASVDDSTGLSSLDSHAFVPPRPGRDSADLLGPSKMRSRSTSAFANHQVATPYRTRLMEIVRCSATSADPVPNLVRGSPALRSLKLPLQSA